MELPSQTNAATQGAPQQAVMKQPQVSPSIVQPSADQIADNLEMSHGRDDPTQKVGEGSTIVVISDDAANSSPATDALEHSEEA